MKIKRIEFTKTQEPTWDIDIPEEHSYILYDGLVSHNSSLISNSTNGAEPVRSLMIYKGSKTSSIPILVPMYEKHKEDYTLAFEMGGNEGLININAALQKFFDMAISTNLYYRYKDYPDEKLPDMVILKDILYSYKMGLKNLYYSNTDSNTNAGNEAGCESGACSI